MKVQRKMDDKTKTIPTENCWWEVVICVASQMGNFRRFARMSQSDDKAHVVVSILASWIAADFVSGLYHWFADSYRTTNSTVNAIFFDNFQLHHKQPSLICKRPLANVNWEVNLPSFVLTILQLYFGMTPQSIVCFPFLAGFCFWISITNQAHRWAHQPQSKIPRIVKILQQNGVILSPQHHHRHHRESHLEDYCITSGICNPLLQRLNLWRRLELVVYRFLGIKSYAMLLQDSQAIDKSAFGHNASNNEEQIDTSEANHEVTSSYLYDYALSPFYDRLAKLLWPDWVHPNFITLTGGVCCSISIYALHYSYNRYAFAFWTLYHMMDNMDGKHARRTQQTSKWGAFLDHSVDGLVGVYMGYRVVAEVVFGLNVGSPLFALGRHCFSLVWLAPHIVHQLDPSKGLVLGTKVCSVDEGFLGVSFLLYFHAWISPDRPLLPNHEDIAETLCFLLLAIALSFVTISAFLKSIRNHWRYSWVGAFLAFALVASACQESHMWWVLWIPFMMLSVADYGK